MIIGILQPGYLPWLGFFEQLHRVDVFVIYDDVQYDKHGWRNRNRIKTANGPLWLTVPVLVDFNKRPAINAVRIDNSVKWAKKHFFSIKQNYSRARYYREYVTLFEEAYSREWEYLVDLDMHFIRRLAECLGLNTQKIVLSSNLDISGGRIERLIDICNKLNADTFYEGSAGRNYIDEKSFNKAGIKIEYQDYDHPVYNQLHGGFIPYLTVVDLLFNHGPESLPIITKHNPRMV